MGTKRSAADSRKPAEKPFQKRDKGHFQSKDSRNGARGPKPAADAQNSSLTIQPRPDWHAAELPPISIPDDVVPPPRPLLEEVHQYAESLLEAENKTYADRNMSADSSHKFLSTIMSSGTLEDKVSALTLLIQESPLHTMKAFENLLGLGRKKSRNQALLALGALKDLLGQGVVLPPERKLRSFVKQPAVIAAFAGSNSSWQQGQRLPPGVENTHLIVWAYEDWLKRTYFEMLRILEGWCNDEIEYSRSRAITFVYELLREKPEQEENLLRLLINKLGDKEKKIASRASYLLLQLQNSHPVMKGVIINAIETECLFRPNQSAHAKYYAIITLNQTILSAKEPDVATKLLDIYFALFLSLLKGGSKSSAKEENKNQGGGGKAGKKAKQKAKAKEREQEQASKSESELNEKLIAGVLTGVNRAFPYATTDDVAFEKQLDTVFRVTHSSNFNTAIQALLLIQQISAAKHFSTDRFYRTLYESLLDPRLLTSSKQVMYLNLLYRSLKADVSIKRVKAFVKRLLQVISLHEPPFVCGVLYLIYELTKTFPSIKTMLSTPELNDDDDEEEHFVDAPEDGDADATPAQPSPFASKPSPDGPRYDGRKRDPEHAHADLSCLWDLTPFRLHFHPSVQLFASRLLDAQEMPPKPDPTLHTLMHFLDRFAYRNARQKTGVPRGVSIMQPMAGSATKADLLIDRAREAARAEAPLNSEQFWRKRVDEVPADEVFFHQYFEKSGRKKGTEKKKDKRKGGDDEEEEGSDAEEDEIWQALVGSRPDVAGPDEESDEELEELDELMAAGEDEDDESEGEEDGGVVIADAPDEDDEDADEEMEDAGAVVEKKAGKEADEGSDAGFDFDDGDEGAFVGSDEELELPSDFDWEDEEDEEEEKKPKEGKKGKKTAEAEEEGDEEGKGRKKRRKLKHLPTFASVDDYAKLLGDDSDGY